MPNVKVSLLVVDDDATLRLLVANIFAAFGHHVRCAEDGFSALAELRLAIPDIILSDLNMPGMSGFEFLSVVRRRFPTIKVIAMSSAVFPVDGVPPGVPADAFYQKGSNLGELLQIMEGMTSPGQPPLLHHASRPAPIWIEQNGHDAPGGAYIMLTCPECLRTFPQVSRGAPCSLHETGCIYCNSLFRYAIVQPEDPAPRRRRSPKKTISRYTPIEHQAPENLP